MTIYLNVYTKIKGLIVALFICGIELIYQYGACGLAGDIGLGPDLVVDAWVYGWIWRTVIAKIKIHVI